MPANNFSFTTAPDLAMQQTALERRRKLAEMLQQQAITPDQGQMVSGIYVAPSPLQGASKLAQALIANHMNKDIDQKQTDLGQQQLSRYADAIKRLAPAGAFDDQPNPALPGQLGSGTFDSVAPQDGSTSIPQPQQSQIDPATKQAWQRAMLAMQIDPELGRKMLENVSSLTNEQKNNAAMGVDPQLIGRAAMAKAVKEGRMEAQPGNTIIDPITLKPLYTAPDFKSGIQGGFDSNGAPVMGAIQGSEVIPQMAGMTKRAEASANADYTPTTVNTPGGPIMTTVGNVVRSVNGTQPVSNMGFPSNVSVPSVNNNQNDRMEIFKQERNQILARPDSDPRKAGDLAAIDREITRLGGNATNPTVNGIPLETEAEKQYKIDTAKNLAENENIQPQQIFAVKNVVSSIDNSIKQIDSLLSDPGLSHITGPVAGRTFNLTGKATNAQAKLDTLKSQASAQVLQSMRDASKTGGAVGQITEREWPRFENLYSALQQSQTTDEFIKSLNDAKNYLNGVRQLYVEQYQNKYGKRDDLKQKPPLKSFNKANRPSLDSSVQR